MALDNATVLETLKQQKAEIEQQIDGGREMYLKIVGAIDVLEQIEASKEQEVVADRQEDAHVKDLDAPLEGRLEELHAAQVANLQDGTEHHHVHLHGRV